LSGSPGQVHWAKPLAAPGRDDAAPFSALRVRGIVLVDRGRAHELCSIESGRLPVDGEAPGEHSEQERR
jgi:hypothetical protein